MTAVWWIAHILSVHLAVPEPVEFRLESTWPHEAQVHIVPFVQDGVILSWRISYGPDFWNRYPELRSLVLAHELCHAVYDYQGACRDQKAPCHDRVRECAAKVLRAHRSCRLAY